LRELALRRTAERVDEQMQQYRHDHAIAQPWPTKERLLVCISPSPLSMRLVRATRRMAAGLGAEWLAVYVETPDHFRLSETERNRIAQALHVAEQLGGTAVTLTGSNVAEEILAYARMRNVSKIIVGKPVHPRWREVLFGSLVDDLARHSGPIDVYVISGDPDHTRQRPPSEPEFERARRWSAYMWAVAVVAVCTLLAGLAFPNLDLSNLVMIYLFGVVIVAIRLGRGPSILASILSAAAFDFFFSPPYLTFAVSDTQYIVTLLALLFIALFISGMAARMRFQAEAARKRERHTSALYAMSREFASQRGLENLADITRRHIGEVFDSDVLVLLPDAAGNLTPVQSGSPALDAKEQGVAQWAYEHSQAAGLGTDTLPGAEALYLPLVTSQGTLGVMRVRPHQPGSQTPDQLRLLETFANQTALVIERAHLAREAARTQMHIEMERVRNVLLNSLSQDLKTPLATITRASTSLLQGNDLLDRATQYELIQAIYENAEVLNQLARNLLDMSRLESGEVKVEKTQKSLADAIASALARTRERLREREVNTHLPPDLPLVPHDHILI
jgi:two-component system sensor histidine kinase KdpD